MIVVIVSRKPLSESTVAKNVLVHGTGGINVDACRINPGDFVQGGGNGDAHKSGSYGGLPNGSRPIVESHTKGRWPANFVLSKEATSGLDTQSGILTSAVAKENKTNPVQGQFVRNNYSTPSINQHGGTGGASRFFKVIQ